MYKKKTLTWSALAEFPLRSFTNKGLPVVDRGRHYRRSAAVLCKRNGVQTLVCSTTERGSGNSASVRKLVHATVVSDRHLQYII